MPSAAPDTDDVREPINANEATALLSDDHAPVATKDANSNDDASETESVSRDSPKDLTAQEARARMHVSVALLLAMMLPVIVNAALLATARLRCDLSSTRFVEESGCDAAFAQFAFSFIGGVAVAVGLARNRRGYVNGKLPVTVVTHHITIIAWIAGTGKLWVYRFQQAHRDTIVDAIVNDIPVALMFLSPPLAMFLNEWVHRIDFPPTIRLKASSVRHILAPYFIPSGWRNRFVVAGTWVLMFGGKAAGVVSPIFLSRAVNQMSATPPESPYMNIFIFGTLALTPRIMEEVQAMIVSNVWRIAYIQVADRTFRHVHSLSLEWHLKKKMGHVIRYMDRGMMAAQQLVEYVIMYIGPAIAVAVSSFIVFATEFNQPRIAAVCFMFMAMYIWLTVVVTVWRKIFFTQMNEHDNDLHDKATDSLINFETVKYFTNEEYEADNYRKSVEEYQRNQRNSMVSVAVLNITQASIMEYCRVVALIIAAHCVMDNSDGFNVGQFMAVSTYLVMLFTPFQFLGSVYEMAVESLVDMQNLSDLLAEDPDMVDAQDAIPLVVSAPAVRPGTHAAVSVEFRGVNFNYPSQSAAEGLKDVSFTVPAGTTTAIVGSTGSGKTTITRLLFRFYDTRSGAVLVDGHDVKKLTQRSLRKHIGIVPQDTVLFNDTIRFNIAYGNPLATQEDIEAAANAAQLLPLIARLEKGWDTPVGERGLKLSGGEKQRVAIARCLLKDPPVVVLDEATSALDNKTEKEVQVALGTLSGRTTIIVAHRLSTVQHADQIVVMARGRILERGTYAELMANPQSEFYSMWNAQLRAASGTAAESDEQAQASH